MKKDDELANARQQIKALLERLAANEHELVALRTVPLDEASTEFRILTRPPFRRSEGIWR
jgi:hypothetical protein